MCLMIYRWLLLGKIGTEYDNHYLAIGLKREPLTRIVRGSNNEIASVRGNYIGGECYAVVPLSSTMGSVFYTGPGKSDVLSI